MSKMQMLNVFLAERLTVAAGEIFVAVEKAIAEYQEEHIRSKQENERLRRLLDCFILDEIKAQGTESDRPLQISLLCEQERSLSLEQDDPNSTWSLILEQDDPEPIRSPSLEQDDPEPTWSPSLEQDDPEPTWSPSLEQDDPEPTWSLSMEQDDPEPTWSPSLEQDDPEPTWSPSLEQDDPEPTRSPSLEQDDPEPTWSLSLELDDPEPTRSLSLEQDDPEPTWSPSLEQDDPEHTRSLSLEQDDPEPTRSPSLEQDDPEPTWSLSLEQVESEPTRSPILGLEEPEPTRRPSPGQENPEPTRRPTGSLSVKECPQPTQIKEEEQEEVWACGEEELKCDSTEPLFTITCVRSLCDQENPLQPSDLNLAQTAESSRRDSPQPSDTAGVETGPESESDEMDYTLSELTSDSQPLSRVNIDSSASVKPYQSNYKSSDLKIVGLHRRGGPYTCKECGQSSRHRWQLAGPYPRQCCRSLVLRLRDCKREHTEDKSYACQKCGQSFPCHLELAKHLSHTRCWAVLSYD